MKKAFLLSFLIFSFTLIYGQGHDIVWENSFGGTEVDFPVSGYLATDGSYVFAGSAFSNNGDVSGNHGNRDFWFINVDNTGNLLWQKCIGGNHNDRIFSLSNTSDGGYIAAGHSPLLSGSWEPDMWLVKLDFNGNIEWQKSLGGSEFDGGTCVIQTSDGGYISVGSSRSSDGDVSINYGNNDCWIVKLNDQGNIEWQKTFGGSKLDGAESIIELEDGCFVFIGKTESDDGNIGYNIGLNNVLIVKLDQLGNLIWKKSYGGSGAGFVRQIVASANGGFTVAAAGSSTNGNFDMLILEIDENGELVWEKYYGGTESDMANSLIKTPGGGNIVVGVTGSNDGDVSGNHGGYDSWVIETDHLGNLMWQQCYGGSNYEHARRIFQNQNGNYVIPSWSESTDGEVSGNHGDLDFWVFEIEGQVSEIPIGSAGIIITVLLIVGVFVIRRTRII